MKVCPQCRRSFQDDDLAFCLYDGHALAAPGASAPPGGPPVTPAPPLSAPPLSAAPAGVPPPAPLPSATPTGGGPGRWVVVGLLALLAFGWFGRHHTPPAAPGPSPGPSAPGTGPSPGPSGAPGSGPSDAPVSGPGTGDDDRASILAALKRADDAEAQALKTVDDTPLTPYYMGNALTIEERNLQKLRQAGMYVDESLTGAQVQSVAVGGDRQTAQVQLAETWDITLYSQQTHQPLHAAPNTVVRQTVSFQRDGDSWRVSDSTPNAQ